MASPELPYCTYRFCKVPAHFDVVGLNAIIPLEKDEWVLSSSLSTDHNMVTFQIGTVTWNKTPHYLRGLVPDDLTAFRLSTHPNIQRDPTRYTATQGDEIEVDSHFRGLTPLNADPEKGEKTVEYVQQAEFPCKRSYTDPATQHHRYDGNRREAISVMAARDWNNVASRLPATRFIGGSNFYLRLPFKITR